MADDLTATVAGMQARHYRIPDYAGICRSDHQKWPCDASLVLAAVEAVLELPGTWDAEAKSLEGRSEFLFERGGETAAVMLDGRSQAHKDCARALREAITAALAGKEAGDAGT